VTDGIFPPPLVPPEVDLGDFGFMPLEVRKLLTSSLWIKAKKDPRLGHAAMSLWCEAWHQVPCASLPDDDEVLAELARCDEKEWKRVKDRVLAHFVRCSDGRLYHETVAKKALESWAAKVAQRERTKAATKAREDKKRQRDEPRNDERDVQRDVQRDVVRNESRDVHQGTGTVKGQGQGDLRGASAPPAPPPPAAPSPAVAARVALVARFKAAGIMPSSTPLLDQLVAAGVTWDEIEPLLPQATGTRNPLGYIAAAVSGQRERAAATVIAPRPSSPDTATNPDVAATTKRLAAEDARTIAKPPAHVLALRSRSATTGEPT
jgi:uncharacterized protein YdaU (DUF1376 family)